jgi:hypothetical protein
VLPSGIAPATRGRARALWLHDRPLSLQVQHALDVEIVDREVGRAADRGSGVAAHRLLGDAIDLQISEVVGEAEHNAVAPRDPPVGRERRHLAREMLGERR